MYSGYVYVFRGEKCTDVTGIKRRILAKVLSSTPCSKNDVCMFRKGQEVCHSPQPCDGNMYTLQMLYRFNKQPVKKRKVVKAGWGFKPASEEEVTIYLL